MERFLWICLAGAAGTGARYLVALWAAQRFGSSFPYGTLIVNLVGCFGLAAVMHAALTLSWSPTLRSAIAIGFIGGLTTPTQRPLIPLKLPEKIKVEFLPRDETLEQMLERGDKLLVGFSPEKYSAMK